MKVNLFRLKISRFGREVRCRSQRDDDEQVEAETGESLRVQFGGRILGLGFESVSSLFVEKYSGVNEDVKEHAENFHNPVNPKEIPSVLRVWT